MMKLEQIVINDKNEINLISSDLNFNREEVNLVLAFGERIFLEKSQPYQVIKKRYPSADIVICSSAGQISTNSLAENNIIATAIDFESTAIKVIEVDILKNPDIKDFGSIVEKELINSDLKTLLVFSEGSFVNGTDLVGILLEKTNSSIPVFGGLAGDGDKFQKTLVGLNSNASEGKVVVVGFYGDKIHFGFGCKGGWSDFGPERQVTHSEKNVLYKIGDRFALDLYKEYLGKYSKDLPGAALYFPLSMKENDTVNPVVRTILAINEEDKSMTFAGNIPQGSFVRLMKANFDKLIDASYDAALDANFNKTNSQLALLVSCVGRKIVLGNRIEEEFEVAKEALGSETIICGFYSYGEISPNHNYTTCEFHNQTIAIATISED